MRLRRSRLTEEQTERLLEHFVAGIPARPAAKLAGVNRNTARLFYFRLREIIAERLAQVALIKGEIEADEIDLGGGLHNGPPVVVPPDAQLFGLLQRGSKVYGVIVSRPRDGAPRVESTRLRLDAIVHPDTLELEIAWDVVELRPEQGTDRDFVAGHSPQTDTIKNFWNLVKRYLRRYNGVPRRHFHLFLRECEWRFNYGSPEELLSILKLWVKEYSG